MINFYAGLTGDLPDIPSVTIKQPFSFASKYVWETAFPRYGATKKKYHNGTNKGTRIQLRRCTRYTKYSIYHFLKHEMD